MATNTRCDVAVVTVRDEPLSPDVGKYRWPRDIFQDEALRVVLSQYTADELPTIVSVTLKPVDGGTLPWLPVETAFKFK